MTSAEITALVTIIMTALPPTIAALAALIVSIRTDKKVDEVRKETAVVRSQTEEVRKETGTMKTELVEAVRTGAFHAGHAVGVDEGHAAGMAAGAEIERARTGNTDFGGLKP